MRGEDTRSPAGRERGERCKRGAVLGVGRGKKGVEVLAEAQKSYFNISEGQVATKTLGKPSAHLIFRPQNPAQDGEPGEASGVLGGFWGGSGEKIIES